MLVWFFDTNFSYIYISECTFKQILVMNFQFIDVSIQNYIFYRETNSIIQLHNLYDNSIRKWS